MGRLNRAAAFVDRDGTINERPAEHEYVTSARDFVWLPGAVDGLAHLARGGFLLAVVSNQRGVARGLLAPEVLAEIERRIRAELAERGCEIAVFKYCFHDEADQCDCRKPKPGMLLEVARELEVDLARSWMIGDSATDIAAGKAAGCHTASVAGVETDGAEIVAGSLAEAAALIVDSGQPDSPPDSASNASTSA